MPNRLHVLPDEPVTSLADHIAAGGGLGLAEALRRDRADVIAEVERSGLRGRGVQRRRGRAGHLQGPRPDGP